MKFKAVYIGDFSPSKMDAQTQLVIGNSRILRELGMDVTLICNDKDMVMDSEAFHHGNIEGFECYSLRFSKSLKGLLNSVEMFSQVKNILDKLNAREIAYVFCYGSIGFANQLLMLSDWCKKNHVQIIANCVDLPDVNHGNMVERIVKKLDRAIRYHAMEKHMDGMIAVSRYIQELFAQKSSYPIAVIPPLKDTQEMERHDFAPRDNVKKIVYVGVPFPIDGRKVDESAYKDRIDLFIDLLCAAACKDWRLDIYGITKEQYSRVVTRQQPLLVRYQKQIVFHGRIGHEKALRIVADADYTVVYRLKNRMTMAGFSTKFVESISCGTPVIMTDTSEYSKYVENGVPSIILDLQDETHRKKALEHALMKTPQEMMEMKEKCRASHVFDYRQYIEPMREFLAQVDSESAKG